MGIAEHVEGVALESLQRDCGKVAELLPSPAMKTIEVETTIAAPPDDVWAVLADVGNYANWDNGVEKVEGRLAPGEKLKVYSELNPGRGYPVKVSELTRGKSFSWAGGAPLGLFKGVRTYRLTPENGHTRFTMREQFSGPLLPLIWRTMPDFQPSFDHFARGLKGRAEGGPA
jgi:hypothetical protein